MLNDIINCVDNGLRKQYNAGVEYCSVLFGDPNNVVGTDNGTAEQWKALKSERSLFSVFFFTKPERR